MRKMLFAEILLVVLVARIGAEDCYDWATELEKGIKICEGCKKEFTAKEEIGYCAVKKSGMVTDDDKITIVSWMNNLLDGFKGGEEKKEIMKKDLEACLKEGKIPEDIAEMEQADKCSDEVLIKHCPEAKERLKEFRENEVIKTCM